ncbi:MAG TPA: GxGYxYP family putative glycoside hydrolase [Rectinema sp.]|nr:GxGYxYP family putative glycoside hydrolase [Rectinema sp.]
MKRIFVLDVSDLSFSRRVSAAALQGLVNRKGSTLYLDYGFYDDPSARRTNEEFIDDKNWFGKYRTFLGNQDEHNIEFYRKEHGFDIEELSSLSEALKKFRDDYDGLVIWDESLLDTVNAAVMLAGLENLIPVTMNLIEELALQDLPIRHDLRNKWTDRLQIYTWAMDNLFEQCKPGVVACIEPGWQRPEFLDYLVEERIFTYSLSSRHEGLGNKLLMLLAFGPPALREVIFALRLDAPIRKFALHWMARRSQEVKISNTIQRKVRSETYPTIFGWHTKRDDELSFMSQLSANGLRLVPAHLAGNFSFHSKVEPLKEKPFKARSFKGKSFKAESLGLGSIRTESFRTDSLGAKSFGAGSPEAGLAGADSLGAGLPGTDPLRASKTTTRPSPSLDKKAIYLTFTLSDGDQLMMMHTGELGNWYSSARGKIAFNWEVQPLLNEIAPALLERYLWQASEEDCIIAGPSGAGYVIPPLVPDLPAYIKETVRICNDIGIRVVTSYIADPSRRVLRQLQRHSGDLLGYLAGYAVVTRTLRVCRRDFIFFSNQIPKVDEIALPAEQLLEKVRAMIAAISERPAFIAVHLFAYRTTIADVAEFAEKIADPNVHIVRADDFLTLLAMNENLR